MDHGTRQDTQGLTNRVMASADRQPFDVVGLRAIGRHAIRRDRGRDVGVAHRGARDFPRRREVTIHQRVVHTAEERH